jgi:surface antigen
VTTTSRFAHFTLSALLVSGLTVALGASSAEATVTTLCKGYAACAKAGMPDAGYGAVSKTMYWRMYTGHNCTNYAAYRMIRAGYSSTRPWSGSGNATNWGTAMKSITTSTPSVGSIAWWKAGVSPAGSAGHVGYVERVVSANEIIVSQDSWNGDFSWTRVTRTTKGWPSGFVHFKDVPMLNTKAPTVSGDSKVGGTLTATPGAWNPAGAAVTYQWLQNGANIAGATAPTLSPTLAQQGKALSVRVTASMLGYPIGTAVSAATRAVQPGVLSATSPPTVTGESRVGSTLSANPGSWTPAPEAFAYQWRVAGAPIAGATDRSLAVDPSLVGKPLSVAVTATKAGYAPVTTTSAPTPVAAPGTLRLSATPTVAGAARPGQVLTLRLPTVSPQPAKQIQWIRNGVPVPGATAPTYRVGAADLGARLLAQITLTRPGYRTLTTRTAYSSPVRATPVLRVATAPRKGRLAVYASVGAAGVRPVNGVIQIRSRGKLLATAVLTNGVARASVARLPHGVRAYRFLYPSTAKVAGASVTRRVRIG